MTYIVFGGTLNFTLPTNDCKRLVGDVANKNRIALH